MFDEPHLSRMFGVMVPLSVNIRQSKKAARKQLMDMLTQGGRDKKHSYKIVKKEFEEIRHNGIMCLQLGAFVSSDAFTPSKFMDWLHDRNGKQEHFDMFIDHYSKEFPEWQSLAMRK